MLKRARCLFTAPPSRRTVSERCLGIQPRRARALPNLMSDSPRDAQNVLVAVMERGSPWPSCIQHCRRFTPDSVVIAQHADESPADLAGRVGRRIATIAREGRRVSTGVIAVGRQGGEAVTAARVQLALILHEGMSPGGAERGKLCLVGSDRMGPQGREQLMALAGMMMSNLGPPAPTIDVRFTDRDGRPGSEACGLPEPTPSACAAATPEAAHRDSRGDS